MLCFSSFSTGACTGRLRATVMFKKCCCVDENGDPLICVPPKKGWLCLREVRDITNVQCFWHNVFFIKINPHCFLAFCSRLSFCNSYNHLRFTYVQQATILKRVISTKSRDERLLQERAKTLALRKAEIKVREYKAMLVLVLRASVLLLPVA